MGFDLKYGKIIAEHGSIEEDEPVFVFRARDSTLPMMLGYYHMICLNEGSSRRHLAGILEARENIMEWQDENVIKTPGSPTQDY